MAEVHFMQALRQPANVSATDDIITQTNNPLPQIQIEPIINTQYNRIMLAAATSLKQGSNTHGCKKSKATGVTDSS
jgi:hypothetical protein